MKHFCWAIAVASLGFGSFGFARTGTDVTPVQKVIQLMEGMLTKGRSEKHDEQVQFAAYKQFCDDTSVEKKRAISEADENIEMLKADIEKHTVDAARLAKEIAEHEEDISAWTGDIKAATKVRSIEKHDYDATHKDYSESVDALERAIAVLKKQAFDRKQTSLLEVSALRSVSLIPQDAKQAIDAFLGDEPEGLAVTAPEASGYEFQSHGVIDMLEKLLDKFISERTSLEKEEMNTKHAFEMLVQDLTAQVGQATADRDLKSENKAKKLQAKATAKGDLTDTVTTRDADQKYLTDLTATCEQKASDFESRQQLRAEELVAIEKAIEIISSSSVSGHADTYLPSFVETNSESFAQLRAESQRESQARVVQYLKSQASKLNSRVLSALAVRMSDDPFVKVKKMIKDLIVRLMEEANEEAEHKGWCDTELSTNEQTRKEKTEAVETLHAEIDELEASISKLTEEITELTQAVADLDAAMAEATELRQEEKKTNAQTVSDSQDAQTAVAQALTVLKEFYAKAGEATALLQQQPVAPEIFDSPYTGMASENGGVIGMLEVIQSDFARLESDTKASEATSQKEYDSFMTDSKVDKEAKSTDIEHKTAKKQDENQALTVKKEDVEGTQKELDAALTYFDKLKPSCVDAGVSYDDRVGRRKDEIESLQEALRILNGEDLA
jgi:cell division septum initiation protein DivIVA